MKIRIGTFNCENLYVYHRLRDLDIRFKTKHELADLDYDRPGVRITALEKGWSIDDQQRKVTARSIVENQPDIIALQEIENLDTLNKFYSDFMKKIKIKDARGVFGNNEQKITWDMPYRILIDGNDNHYIDVALISRFPITEIRTHIWDTRKADNNREYPVFPRDCLEVDVQIPTSPTQTITFLVNHFTSRRSDKTGTKRRRQAEKVIEIIKERFGQNLGNGNFIILGDLNDTPGDESLKQTLYNPSLGLIDPIKQLPTEERWTHFWYDDKTGKAKSVSQLDHILLSPSFRNNNPAPEVTIERRGLLQTVRNLANVGNIPAPFKGVSNNLHSEGSDHCPALVDLEI